MTATSTRRGLTALFLALALVSSTESLHLPGIAAAPHPSASDPADATRRKIWGTAAAAIPPLLFLSPAPAHSSSGAVLPDPGEISSALPTVWPGDAPFDGGSRRTAGTRGGPFGRLDESPDARFYSAPKLGEHVDAAAVRRMNSYLTSVLRPGDDVLDLGSSWTSHLGPAEDPSASPAAPLLLGRVAGLGMNADELAANAALTERAVLDLNAAGTSDGRLPYPDGSFNAVLCQLSADYFVYPLDVFAEAGRVLRPGGRIHVLFSNRLFIEKAVGIWTGADDVDHAYTVGAYLHYCGGGLEDVCAKDLSARSKKGNGPIVGDPLYVVSATKK